MERQNIKTVAQIVADSLVRHGVEVMTDPLAYPPITSFDGLDGIGEERAGEQSRAATPVPTY